MLSQQQQNDVYQLWDELGRFDATQTQTALEHLLRRLAQLTGSQRANWFGSVHLSDRFPNDPLDGWRPVGSSVLDENPKHLALIAEHKQRINGGQPDSSILEALKEAGTFRVIVRHQHASSQGNEDEFASSIADRYRILDAMYAATPIDTYTESWIGLQRLEGNGTLFSEQDKALLELTLRPLGWLLKRVVLLYGIKAVEQPITPAERRVLEALLGGDTEQAIADRLYLSPSTVRTYCKRICYKLNVRGRSGLQALWLGKGG